MSLFCPYLIYVYRFIHLTCDIAHPKSDSDRLMLNTLMVRDYKREWQHFILRENTTTDQTLAQPLRYPTMPLISRHLSTYKRQFIENVQKK